MPSDRADVYQTITDQIVAQLENGVRPRLKPWAAEHAAGRITRPLRFSGEPYRGINTIMLWLAAEAKGYTAPIWMTFRQASELKGAVRKGEKSTLVTYADKMKRKDEATGEDKEIFFMKGYPVLNVEQIDGLPAHYYAAAEAPKLTPLERHAGADAFIRNTGAVVGHGGNRAYYAEGPDRIQMPPFETFKDPESYYTTAIHELGHWTKHPSRLDRDLGRKKWGDEGYAMEELLAELSATFIAADLGLEMAPREEHAAYLASWLKVLKDDKRAILNVSSQAQRAADFLHSYQPKLEAAVETEKPVPATAPALPSLPAPEGGFAAAETRRREVKGQGRSL